ncbi:hypothetical protein UFOVP585_25 [uncultured Caudovirales phage]|uniref:Uncharacterized protein n=1 Tax=uncultured Caudovirales phage TaxID=2100421 RepID=A0A6J5N2R1_9CAUD|nr:hypothetical protein UFOVP585_25 [uncultured Caudovirales phage]
MRLSIFTTITDPSKRGDNAKDALACYEELADELVVVDGSRKESRINAVHKGNRVNVDRVWPKEFSWEFIGQQFQRGYEASTGDWVIHADLDFIFHERDFARIRQLMIDNPNTPAMSFYKHQFIQPDRYNLKSRIVLAVNKKLLGNRIKFDSGGDMCQPSLDGRELKPDYAMESGVAIYNYDKLLKTEVQVRDDVSRMARAWKRRFNSDLLGHDEDSAYMEWAKMVFGRYGKPQEKIPLSAHPKFVQETIKNLTPDQFGYNGFGMFPDNNYVQEASK